MSRKPSTIAERVRANTELPSATGCGRARQRLSTYCPQHRQEAERYGVPGGNYSSRVLRHFDGRVGE